MSKEKKEERTWLEYSSVGLMFPASIAVGLTIGYFLDKWLKTAPVLLIVFTLYGVGAGFYHVYRVTRRDGEGDGS